MKYLFILLLLAPLAQADDTAWPPVAAEAKPWTRWWWLGSGVDNANLTRQLEAFSKAGIGGVEICPIYGAKGFEDRDLPFLSDEWTAAYAHAARECERLGLGIDLTTGTGWPFGGPWVTDEMASHALVPVKHDAPPGDVTLRLPSGKLECLMAFPEAGDPVDLAGHVTGGTLKWNTDKFCRIRGILSKSPVQKVKRAAPGGAGNVLDPFSPGSLKAYLARFDASLGDPAVPAPRAHFHDSFEYYGANWTPGLPDAFRRQHGYDLSRRLPAFFGEGERHEVERVARDYRATLDLLHRSYLETWNAWAKAHGSLTRNQAHGSPGNLLDHYAVADIPETEIFRHVDDEQIPMLQFAASAAHVTGKNLVSAESFTWLGEHFQVKPAALKEAADFLWLGGVNHLFFHGIPYSPEDAGWPGWLFYASTHLGENGGLWRDLPAFNGYIGSVQSELQSGRPDTAVLLYFPVHDLWSKPSKDLPLFTIHNQDQWLHKTAFHEAAMMLWESGIPCDFVSDRLLEGATVKDGKILLGGRPYEILLLPEHVHKVPETDRLASELSEQGARIASLGGFPEEAGARDPAPLLAMLESKGIPAEPMTSHGLRFVRRVTADGHSWFIVNCAEKPVDDWIPLSVPFTSALFIDPSRPNRAGNPEIKDHRIHFRFAPGESRILRTSTTLASNAKPWSDLTAAGDAVPLAGPWKLEFLDGGPAIPPPATLDTLRTWTGLGEDARNFSGTVRYTTTFAADPAPLLLDLGTVAETCRATLNGKPLGISIFPPHRFEISDHLKAGTNVLEVEVTNLAANRIADLDRRKVPWKAFHEINFVNIDYKPFDASTWKPLPSGLLGPVRLVPVR